MLKDVYVSEKTQVADSAFAYCDDVKIHRYGEGFGREDFDKENFDKEDFRKVTI